MKPIIVACDFSDVANNAVFFGANLAQELKTDLYIVSAYLMPITTTYDVAFPAISPLEMRESIQNSLDRLKGVLESNFPQLKTYFVAEYGNTEDVIGELAEKINALLIVTGLSGKGPLESFVIGSTTKAIINLHKFPVLAIPNNYEYKKPRKVALGIDLKVENNFKNLFFLGTLLNELHCKLMIVSVVSSLEEINPTNALSGLEINNVFYDVEHTFHFPEDDNPSEQLTKFDRNFEIDWLTVMTHHHGLMQRIFSKGVTSKLLEKSPIPILSIPELNG